MWTTTFEAVTSDVVARMFPFRSTPPPVPFKRMKPLCNVGMRPRWPISASAG
jgi:hypothetical protein